MARERARASGALGSVGAPAGRVGRDKHLEGLRRGADEELAAGIETDLDPGQWFAHPSAPASAWAVEGDHRPRLGEAVALDERHPPRGEGRQSPFPQRCPARHADAHPSSESRREVGDRPRCKSALEPLVECRHAEDHRRGEESAGLEDAASVGHDIETAAPHQRRGEVAGAGQRVAHREPCQADVVRLVEKHLRRGQGVGQERPL